MTARSVLNEIGKEFNQLRSTKGKTEAWKTYQRRLMEHFGILCEIMTPKDITELSMKIEADMKTESGSGQGSALDEVRKFLDGTAVN